MSYTNGIESAQASAATPAITGQQQGSNYNQSTKPNPFAKAVKYNAKGRVALIGPGGSGKSFTMLTLARALAGPSGRIAAIDTEHGSLSKYADVFAFDVLELDSFSPQSFVESLHAAEDNGYAVFCCDSLSHFWIGKDGALEFVDTAAKRNRDQMGGWKEFRPHERRMIDEMIKSSCHVICTMRTKTDYQEQVDANGRKKRVKIGLAPVQRDGMEYEFDLVGYMDEDNTFLTDKTRCPAYAQKATAKPDSKAFAPFVEWLNGAVREMPKPAAVVRKPPQAVVAAAEAMPELHEECSYEEVPFEPGEEAELQSRIEVQLRESIAIEAKKTAAKLIRSFAALKGRYKALSMLKTFDGILALHGVKDPREFPDTAEGMDEARAAYKQMIQDLTAREAAMTGGRAS